MPAWNFTRIDAATTPTATPGLPVDNGTNPVQGPTITSVEPSDGARTRGPRPTVRASYTDLGLVPGKISLSIDGVPVDAVAQNGEVSYTPPSDLAPGTHTATLEVTDAAGRTTTRSWTFTVESAAVKEGSPLLLIGLVVLALAGAGVFLWMRSSNAKGKGPPKGGA